MVLNMKDNFNKISEMAKESLLGLMEVFMKACLNKIKLMDQVIIFGVMEDNILDNGLMER